MEHTSQPSSHEQRKIERLLDQIAKRKPPQSVPAPQNKTPGGRSTDFVSL